MQVWIKKTGFKAMDWDSDIRQMVEVPLKHPFHYFKSAVCHIEDGVTLGDIFNIVDQYPELKHFLGEYSWCDVDAFHVEAKVPTTNKSDLHYIEISRCIEVNEHQCQENLDVHGVGDPPKDGGIHSIGQPNLYHSWAIDFILVNEIRHLPVRLKPDVEVINERKQEDGKYKREPIAKAEAYFTLLEVLGEIYFEISFHGSPRNREEKLGELTDAYEAVKSGEAKTVPLDEVLDKLKEKPTIQ